MVGYCHGGNVLASHVVDDGDVDGDDDDNIRSNKFKGFNKKSLILFQN